MLFWVRKQLAMYPILGSHTATQRWRFSCWDRSVSPASPPSALIAYTNEDVRRGLGKYVGVVLLILRSMEDSIMLWTFDSEGWFSAFASPH